MIVEFFTNFGFVVELIVAIAILVYPIRRRNKFLLRLVATILALFLFAILWKLLINVTVFTVILRHIVLYFLSMYGIMFCFESGIWSSVFLGTAAFTIQHTAYKIGYLIRSYMDMHFSNAFLGIFFYILIIFVIYTFAFLFISNKLKDEENFLLKSSNKEIILIASTLILFTTIFQNVFEYLIDRTNFILLLSITSYDLVSCVLTLMLMFGILRSSKLYHEKKVLEHVLHMQQEQLDHSKSNIDIINVKYHDLKYLISSLNSKISNEDLESLNKAITVYDLYLKTGNEALDVVLAEKRLQCEPFNIKINCIADGEKLNFFQTSEVYSLFGNAIDNAISAVQKIENKEKRVINISVKESMGMISIAFENYFTGELEYKDELPVTTKENKAFHGYGMKSIKLIVDKYNGYMTVKTVNLKFILSILLSNK